jgi:hypothetical protein
MFDNPYFQYAGINNPQGAMPYIVSVQNLNITESEIKLFNAQNNQTSLNKGLPAGVVANSEAIFEMPISQTFSCFRPSPIGFPTDTVFELIQGGFKKESFTLTANLPKSTADILSEGYEGTQNTNFYQINKNRLNVNATAEGTEGNLRFIFSVTSMTQIGNIDIADIRVSNITSGCVDRFPLTKILTGFNSSDSTDASSYGEILATTNFTPLGVDHILIQSENVQAIATNPIILTRKDANGNRDSKEIALSNSPYIRPNQRTIQSINELDGTTELEFTIPPETSVTLFIYAKDRMAL